MAAAVTGVAGCAGISKAATVNLIAGVKSVPAETAWVVDLPGGYLGSRSTADFQIPQPAASSSATVEIPSAASQSLPGRSRSSVTFRRK